MFLSGITHEVDIAHADGLQHEVDHTGFVPQEDPQHAAHNHGGNEVRQVGDGLNGFLELGRADFVDQNREGDGQGPVDRQGVDADQQGVADRSLEMNECKEIDEVFEDLDFAFNRGPGAAPDAFAGGEVLEGDDDAVHGPVQEDQEVHDRGNDQHIQLPVPEQIFFVASQPEFGALIEYPLSKDFAWMVPGRLRIEKSCKFLYRRLSFKYKSSATELLNGEEGVALLPSISYTE